ncbi:hypothetical protein BDZ91DRAFT_49272 [Kalaharituber pfeilii]|nr:hypothetical protein BDZ91DRAFT_49272 [Kalaharituber pfeilii]
MKSVGTLHPLPPVAVTNLFLLSCRSTHAFNLAIGLCMNYATTSTFVWLTPRRSLCKPRIPCLSHLS